MSPAAFPATRVPAMKTAPVVPSALASLLTAFAVLLGGCASSSTYTVEVDAISQPAQPAATAGTQSYRIKVSNPKVDEDSLRYKEVAAYVRTALSGKGMYEAPQADQADVVVEIDYGMESPRVRFDTQAAPIVLVEQGDGIRYEQEPIYDLRGVVIGYRTVESGKPVRVEMLDTRSSIRPVIVYEKYLKLSARSNRQTVDGRVPPEVWSVNVSAEDESNELRRYLPVLASATADYIGTNTKQEKPVKLKEGDAVVGFIRKGI